MRRSAERWSPKPWRDTCDQAASYFAHVPAAGD